MNAHQTCDAIAGAMWRPGYDDRWLGAHDFEFF
jgi:hypothetical protein